MINNLLKNICLIGFALIGPITLPAGGIQKNFKELIMFNNSREIILKADCELYTFPNNNAKKLVDVNTGSSLLILNKFINSDKGDIWARVELATNIMIENPNKIRKGWIKM